MKLSLSSILLFALLFVAQWLTFQHCATPTSPTGGPRDTLGPVLVPEETTANFQTNFRPEEIVLTFDEWVELDPKQQIIISPPLELGEDNVPKLRRRSLIIPLTGLTLRDSVTYVVNVGSAIKDLNEGNPTENLRFVFATGPILDSAMVSGTLVEDYSGEPIESATFTLFSNLADTATTTENPTYFAQTDEEGKFTVFNIRPGQYRAVALLRNPSATNYYFDLSGYSKPQSVGFIDTIITVADGSNEVGTIRLSALQKPVRINETDTSSYGLIKLTMNQSAEGIDLEYAGNYLRRNHKDSIKLFYTSPQTDTIFAGRDTIMEDTIVFTASASPPAPAPELERGPNGNMNPVAGITFTFNQPILAVDSSRISLLKDTFPDRLPISYSLDSIYPGELTINHPGLANERFAITLLPGAVRNTDQVPNADTLQHQYIRNSLEKYGRLTLNVTGLDSTGAYLLQLLDKDDPVVGTQRRISGTTVFDVIYPALKPTTYRVEIISDTNRNGRYDTGDFLLGRQPEVIRRFDIEALRPNWEVEETIDLQ
jgi:hypothetical protein